MRCGIQKILILILSFSLILPSFSVSAYASELSQELVEASLEENGEMLLTEGDGEQLPEDIEGEISEDNEEQLSEDIEGEISEGNGEQLPEDTEGEISEANEEQLPEDTEGQLPEDNTEELLKEDTSIPNEEDALESESSEFEQEQLELNKIENLQDDLPIVSDVEDTIVDDEIIEEEVLQEVETEEVASEELEEIEVEDEILVEEVVIPSYQAASGVFGSSYGFSWTYDENTSTLTVTGEDSGLNELSWSISNTILKNVKKVVFKDCVVTGSMRNLLNAEYTGNFSIESVIFDNVDTSNVTDMSKMFYICKNLKTLDVRCFDTSNVTDMSYMFASCLNLPNVDVSNFDTSNVTNMSYMFNAGEKLVSLDVRNFNTSNVSNMSRMFGQCMKLKTLDVSNFDTSNVTNISEMFYICESLTALNVSNFDTSNVTNMSGMFGCCSSLENLDLSNFITSKVTDLSGIFNCCSALKSVNISNFDTSSVTDMSHLFSGCNSLISVDLRGFNTSKVTDMSHLFHACDNLSAVNMSNLNTSNVTNMSRMFSQCPRLTNIILDGIDTSKVTDMSFMFYDCNSLKGVDVSGFDSSNVTDMSGMFSCCYDITNIILDGLNTSKVTNMSHMFSYCSELVELNLDSFDTSKVTDMSYMFTGLTSMTELDLSRFDTSNVTETIEMLMAGNALLTLKTPKVMAAGQYIELPCSFQDSEGNILNGFALEHCNKTLIKYEPVYKITYYLYGGKNNTSNPQTYTKKTAAITLKNPTKTGYTFGGWYSDNKLTKRVTTIPKGSTGNKTVYAKWTVNTYNIAFKGNGSHSGTMSTISNCKYGSSYTLKANTFKRTGYTFTGWNTKADGTGDTYKNKASVKNLSSSKGKTVTLYAQWKPINYSIKYSLNGGKNNSTNPTKYTVATNTITLKSPTKTGYKFKGWYSDSKYTKQVKNITKGSTGAKTLYAKWEVVKYSIKYNVNGGKNNSKNPSSYTVSTADIKLQNPARNGYKFKGWYSDSKCTKRVTAIAKGSTGAKTLYAKWEVVKYSIKYNVNGGKNNSKNPSSYTVSTANIKLQNPTKVGYKFKGWYSDKKCTKRVTTIAKGSTGAKTLYAKWSKK